MTTSTLSIWLLAASLLAQAPKANGGLEANPADRLQFMKESVQGYEIRGRGAQPLALQHEPAFRLGKQGADILVDGAVFLWKGESGRPEAANQVFLIKTARGLEGRWVHEFTSLSPVPLTATRKGRATWAPTAPGLEFRPVPGASAPADSPSRRQRQMSELAQGFRASDDFHGKGWSELRLLSKPIAHYGSPGSEVADGALFALVLGTDPEVFVFLETREARGGLEWQYALAPMTVFALKVSYQDKAVWSAPNREPANNSSRPFFDTTYIP